MAESINFGIDLGTTNSLIAKYTKGQVAVFKNPNGHKETLPSVVAWRNNRILIGDKAREFILRDPQNVKGSFKRKMGTNEKFFIPSIGKELNPVELSSIILKELKSFNHSDENIEEIIITIPASFDTVQSNATKQAGILAGFNNIYLLQEPIAACLAFFNSQNRVEVKDGCWLVYDLGGGTFDTALVKIKDGELKVIDHEGNNFLGGNDFDELIVDELIIPKLLEVHEIKNIDSELKTTQGKYNSLYYKLLRIAEEVKTDLSQSNCTEVDFDFETESGEEKSLFFEVQRHEFEQLITPIIQETINQTLTIIERNELRSSDINELFLVGGSTFIPVVREMLEEALEVKLNTSIDPTNAVAIGAAYYAGTKQKSNNTAQTKEQVRSKSAIEVKMAYQKVSQDDSEYFAARIPNTKKARYYRIVRSDNAFDSGLKESSKEISEILPLLSDTNNNFCLSIYDKKNNCLYKNDTINITQGKYGVIGQPLPEDICIELDDPENNTTKLEVVFARNSILPVKKTITKELIKPLQKHSDESIIINLLEGPHNSNPSSNKSIGIIEIKGCDLTRDLARRSDVEISIEITESRDVKINTYLNMSDQEFEDVFSASERSVNITKLLDELNTLRSEARLEIQLANSNENYEVAAILVNIETDLNDLLRKVKQLSNNDITDKRYQSEDLKRKLSQKLFNATKENKLYDCLSDYYEIRDNCKENIDHTNNTLYEDKYDTIIRDEKKYIASGNIHLIKRKRNELSNLNFKINWEKPEYVIFIFYHYRSLEYPNQAKANELISNAEDALARKNYDELRSIVNMLDNLLPEKNKRSEMKGTGIG